MNTSDVTNLILILVCYGLLLSYNHYLIQSGLVKRNFEQYKCNPAFIPFAQHYGYDPQKLMYQCIQDIQTEEMPKHLEPVTKSINNLENKVMISQLPLSDKNFSHLTMNEPEFIEGWSMNSYGKATDYEGKKFNAVQKYKILGTSIDSLTKNNILKSPNYIKIDVDGIEDKILIGGKKTLKNKKVKSISIEVNENYKSQYKSIIKILKELRFVFKHKKHAEIYNKNKKFNKVFNYVFYKK